MKIIACSAAILIFLSAAAFACGPDKDRRPEDLTLTRADQYVASGAMYSFIMPQPGEPQTDAAQPAEPASANAPAPEPVAAPSLNSN